MDGESEGEGARPMPVVSPSNAFVDDDTSDEEGSENGSVGYDDEFSEDDEEIEFDEEVEKNTEVRRWSSSMPGVAA